MRSFTNVLAWAALAVGCTSVGWFAYSRHATAHAEAESLEKIQSLADRWADTSALLESTPRIALAAQVSVAQELLAEARALRPAGCARSVAPHLESSIAAGINAGLSHLNDDRSAAVASLGRSKSARADALSAAGVCRGEPPIDFSELN